jgi:hypothetical protein
MTVIATPDEPRGRFGKFMVFSTAVPSICCIDVAVERTGALRCPFGTWEPDVQATRTARACHRRSQESIYCAATLRRGLDPGQHFLHGQKPLQQGGGLAAFVPDLRPAAVENFFE